MQKLSDQTTEPLIKSKEALGVFEIGGDFAGEEQQALLNILEDMQEDKNELENQRLATFNILEDINLAQDELRRKYTELDVIKSLTQKLSASLEMKTVMENIVRGIRRLFPSITISYLIAPLGTKEISNIIYVHSPVSLGEKYLETISKSLILGIQTMPNINNNLASMKSWLEKKFFFEIVEGKRDKNLEETPSSIINIPMVVPGAIAGLVNLSSSETGVFGKKELDIIYTIISSASQTIQKLKALVASEHSRLQDLVESMSNAVLMFDANRQIVVANPTMKKIVNLENEKDFHLDSVIDYFEKNLVRSEVKNGQIVKLSEAINRAIESTKTVHIEELPIKRRFYEIFVTPVRDWQKKTSGGAIILHDITHLKEVDRMKTEFVSVASHQLRTPLSTINWYVEMLQAGDAGKLNSEQQRFLDEIYHGSVRMVKLVNDLLNVSRLETGRLKIEPNQTDLIKFIQDIIHEVEPWSKEHNCHIKFNKPDVKLPKVDIDVTLTRQVIHNLITNAIRYSPSGDCDVRVAVVVKKDAYEIRVSDKGIGIPKEAQPRIFEKFFRADNARETEAEGSGIGLYIAKMIAEASGGRLWFESPTFEKGSGKKKIACGTTFYFAIPKTGMKALKGEKGLA